MALVFYGSFCKCEKRKKKMKKVSQYLKSHISEVISLKFGMWSAEVGGCVHSKICLIS